MKHLSVLIKAASSLCNLRCEYCFYANISSLREVESYGNMSKETTERMIDQIAIDLDEGDEMTFAFQGGEPTLAGIRYYQHFTKYAENKLKNVKIHYAIQTNGTLLDEEWINLFEKYDFLVGLSIDCCPRFHNRYRLDTRNEGTYSKVLESKKLLDQSDLDYNILSVLTEDMAQAANEIFDYIVEEDIRFIQFIPCLDDLDAKEKSEFALSPSSFASFYKTIFKRWQEEWNQKNYYSIQLIDSVVNLLAGRGIGICGLTGNCSIQFIIEGDGTVFPCDFYALDDYKLGNIKDSTLFELRRTKNAKDFLCSSTELSDYCKSCPFVKICHGGCKRMKHSMYLNEEENYCGYQDFLTESWPEIAKIVQSL